MAAGFQPCDGPLCGSAAHAVLDSDMQSRSATVGWHSHLQKGKADIAGVSSISSSRSYTAYASYLRRAVDVLELSRNASNQELDKLVDQFIAAHTASTDHCPAELMEAKHQLNTLHKMIKDIADNVKTLEDEIQQSEQKKNKASDDLKKLKQIHDEAKSDSADAREDARKFLATLRGEMAEMRKIAQPSVTMNMTAKTVKVALVQAPPPSSNEVKSTQAMVQKTKAASSELLTCLQEATAVMPENQNRASLMQVHGDVEKRRHVAAEKALLGVLASPNCSVNSTTSVMVGNTTKVLLSPADIANETYRSHHCSHVDAAYGGTIWLHCVNGVLSGDSRGCIKFPSSSQCQSQRKALQETYVKAYVGLARLIDQYEQKVADTAVDEAAKKEHDDAADPKTKEQQDLSDDIAKKMNQLQDLRSKLDDAWKAETKLQQHIVNLGKECKLLGSTTQYLADVRTAIHALEACPGLQRAEFHIPLFKNWTTFTLDKSKTDAQTDAQMTAACEAKFPGTRAAEVSEIEGHSVEAAPLNNTALVPLLGACPLCEGMTNLADIMPDPASVVSGHARVCWFPGKPLDLAHRNLDCYQNMKAIMCVSDRGDVRKLAGFATMPPNATVAPSR